MQVNFHNIKLSGQNYSLDAVGIQNPTPLRQKGTFYLGKYLVQDMSAGTGHGLEVYFSIWISPLNIVL